MKKYVKRNLLCSVCSLATFVLWTALLKVIDVQAIGPNSSLVGFATLNDAFHNLTGVHFTLYNVTDWLGLVPIAFCLGFAVLGLVQWIKRKKLTRVDFSIFALGGSYIVTIAVYILFETVIINYRPILINGYLEVSYPSSTTLLVMCVMPTALIQLKDRIKNKAINRSVTVAIAIFIAFMVIGRLVSGVHWLSDIIGGVYLSAGLVTLYQAVVGLKTK